MQILLDNNIAEMYTRTFMAKYFAKLVMKYATGDL